MIIFSLSFPYLLLLVFLAVLFVSTVYSFFLIYHWRAYGENGIVIARTITMYLIGVACLLIGMATAIGMAL